MNSARSWLLLCSLSVSWSATAAAPSREEKLKAIATTVHSWEARAPNSALAKSLANAIAFMVMDAANVRDSGELTLADLKALTEVTLALNAMGADPSPAIDDILKWFRCASKQREAQRLLKGVWVAEKSYFAEFDAYHPQLKKIGFDVPANASYRIEILKADKDTFKARAVGLADMAGDEWAIDDANSTPVAAKNVCPK